MSLCVGTLKRMWSAIRGDLADFVATLQKDADEVVSAVIGDGGEEDDEHAAEALREQAILDLQRSYNTYANDVEDAFKTEYSRFMKSFALADCGPEVSPAYNSISPHCLLSRMHAGQGPPLTLHRLNPYTSTNTNSNPNTPKVAELLDEEPDVARHYTALVPTTVSPELFWGRYFFKLEVLLRGGGIMLGDEDDEEEEREREPERSP